MHIFEDHFLVETINPDTGEVLPPGEMGEIVFYHPDQRGLSADPLPDPGYFPLVSGALPLRPDPLSDGSGHGTKRRYADHPRRQCLPLPDRSRACGYRGSGTALPAHRGPSGHARHAGSSGRSLRKASLPMPTKSKCCKSWKNRY